MVTDDKVKTGGNYGVNNNVNVRDQKSAGIILIVLVALFVAFLIGLGMAHAPQAPNQQGQEMTSGPGGGQPLSSGESASTEFDVNRPVGVVEQPGTIGKTQKYLSGQGNTPVPVNGAAENTLSVPPNQTTNNTQTSTPANANKATLNNTTKAGGGSGNAGAGGH